MISVVIPVHNGERYLAEAIESVLNQTYAPSQVLVIDDGSTDNTPAVARAYAEKVRYIRQEQKGPAAARDLGVRLSPTEFIAFLDADDIWMPEKLSAQMRAFTQEPEFDLVFCHMIQFRSPDLPVEVAATLACDERPQPSPLVSCLLTRRSAFERVGPLRTDIQAEFVEWYLRARDGGLRLRYVDEVLVRRRLHASNLTRRNNVVRQEYLQVLKASLDRRRAGHAARE